MTVEEIQLMLILAGLLMSAYFSGTETVFLSASRVRLEIFFRRNVKSIKRIYDFIARPESFIVTTLVGTNLSNVIFSTLVVLALKNRLDEILIIVISTGTLLIFGEIIPKVIGREFSEKLIVPSGMVLKFFKFIFAPVNWLLLKITNFFLNRLNLSMSTDLKTMFTRRDILKVLHESEKMGAIESKESQMIKKIFDLRKIRLKDAMVPRTEIIAVPKNVTMRKLKNVFMKSGHSRLPVYDGSIDRIIGIIYAKDLFTKPKTVSELIKPVKFFPDSIPAYRLLLELKKEKLSIAIVLDEYSGVAGLITIEDLIEELIGEIYDEFDILRENLVRKLNDRTFLIDARAEIDELNEAYKLNIPEKESYSTLGGFITEQLQHIPKVGEMVETDTVRMIVTNADKRKVSRVKVILKKRSKKNRK